MVIQQQDDAITSQAPAEPKVAQILKIRQVIILFVPPDDVRNVHEN